MAGAYKMAHKNAANCPKLFGGQFAAFLCMIVYMVSTQFRASPFERALFSALNRVSLKN